MLLPSVLTTNGLADTMGGVEISPRSEVRDTKGKPIPNLFACGELAGGVHGANRLGGSSLLGCVVFGRVAGDSAAAALTKSLSSSSATQNRLQQVGGHLGVSVDPTTQRITIDINFGQQQGGSGSSQQAQSRAEGGSGSAQGKQTMGAKPAKAGKKEKEEKKEMKEYTLEEVAKHTTKDDCWVVVNGQVLSVSSFLPDHPGGERAIMLYAGKDATEEFK